MITVQTVENIKRGSSITFYNGIYAVLLGIYYIASFSFAMKMNFNSLKLSWQIFNRYNSEISALFFKLVLIEALFMIAIGIAVMYLSSYIGKRKDKTAWVMLFIIGTIFWPSLLVVEILNYNILNIALSFIGWLTFIIGMLFPIKYYLQRSDEY